ncbi:MAG: IS4 family transposase [Woeseiaceae bacterium]|nr:IS4 family transposase [Woeseiaceae bacterium]
MRSDFKRQCAAQQWGIAKQARQIDANHFFNLLTGPELLDVVEEQLPEHRERLYPPTQVLAMFLAQAMSADGSCQQVVNEAIVSRLLSGMSAVSASTGGYCIARQRLPEQMVSELVRHSGRLLGERVPEAWRWRGRTVKLVDGTTVSMPDTAENLARFPQHGKQRPGAGCSLARVVGVISLSTGAVLEAALGPIKGKGTGEYGLYRQLRGSFVADDIVLADAYFCSYFLIADLLSRGVDGLFEQHGGRRTDFAAGKQLGVRDHVVSWSKPGNKPSWMSREDYLAYPDEIRVRELKVGKKVLVTTFLEPRAVSKGALKELFWCRWDVELDLRNIKSTLGMDSLRCKTPQMCQKELWVYLLAYNLIRLLMAATACRFNLLPRQLSFKHTLQVWIAWSQRQFLSAAAADTANLFMLIAQVRVGDRPGRVEPRAIKRRPKWYPRLQKPRWQAREDIRKHGHPQKLI